MTIDTSEYKVGIVISLANCGNCKSGGKSLRLCKVRIGGVDNENYNEEDVVSVVTSAPNVRENSR
jgi:hypothetical protein